MRAGARTAHGARPVADGGSGAAEAFLAALAGEGSPAGMDAAIDALLDGPPRPRADHAGAAVALGRAVDAVGGPGALPRGGPAIVLVTVPSPGWVGPVAALAETCLARVSGRVVAGARRGLDPFVLEGDGSASGHRPDKRNDDVADGLCMGVVVVGVSHDPGSFLPRDLVRGADLRLAVAGIDPDGVGLVVEAVTGARPRGRLPDALAPLCDPADLVLAVHAARGADASLDRLARILAAKAGTNGDGPRLEDLAGYGAARTWGLALVADLAAWRAGGPGAPRWRDLESAILLSGPPGVGKTVFAAALARSAGLPLHAGSLGQWQAARDGHLGHTLGAMRAFFERARRAPCVALIDEADSFGDRSRHNEADRDYHGQVCNALLEHLDGSEGREGVVVVAATNHPDRIDPAILRSGRLDRHVRIALPGPEDLARILAHHLGGALPGADLRSLADRMAGMSGADVEALVRRARGVPRRAGRVMTCADLEAALEPAGPPMPAPARRRVAVHEAGHALAAWASGVCDVRAITIDADGGMAWVESREALGLATEADLDGHLAVVLAGRAAELAVLGDVTAGSHRDLEAATRLAHAMETQLGFSHSTPLLAFDAPDTRDLALHPDAAAAVHGRLASAFARALALMRRRRRRLERLAGALEREGRLDARSIRGLLGGRRSSRVPRTYA